MYLWQVTDDITNYTSADLFSSVGKSTDVIVRFSQVTGLLGSPDWMRAPHSPYLPSRSKPRAHIAVTCVCTRRKCVFPLCKARICCIKTHFSHLFFHVGVLLVYIAR